MESLVKVANVVELVPMLLGYLSEREKQIIVLRHGIDCQIKTLAEVGIEFAITRERVRQIQNNAYKKLNRMVSLTNLNLFTDQILNYVTENGGIVLESELKDYVLNNFTYIESDVSKLFLAIIIDGRFAWEHNKVNFNSHFSLLNIDLENSKKKLDTIILILQKKGKPVSIELLASKLKLDYAYIQSLIKIDKRLCIKNNEISLLNWRFINPKTLFDKIMYVLNKYKKPIHFNELTKIIKEQDFDLKKISVQAIHNELISNPDFVLIGRGIYALKSWGYKEGTVADVIASVLEKKGPMHLYDLTQEVLQRRKVKPVTIQVNLNSHKARFKKNPFGLYEVI